MPMPCPACKTPLGMDLQFIIKHPVSVCPGCGIILDFSVNDEIRKKFNDWDFTEQGRLRQSLRMREIADVSNRDYIITDFVCPLPIMRDTYAADFTVWVDTIAEGRYEDTNRMFEPPEKYDVRVTEQDAAKWAKIILEKINDRKI